jgi:ketol-acid reductoisomerase
MMQAFYDSDADLGVLADRKVAIMGYGNQGRAQGLNLRDSGVDVIVGNIPDDAFDLAVRDGFAAMSIGDAASQADILCIYVPDEAQHGVYEESIAPNLRSGTALCFAHGYSIRYGLIRPAADVDVIMVAPRMIGVGVRERFLAGSGAPVFVAVEQDATGTAWPITLAFAKGIGATRVGALSSSFAEETELDHFMEQAVWPTIFGLLKQSFEFLSGQGYHEEAILMELYASGEASEIMHQMAQVGMFRQTKLHSHTSQYGTLSRSDRMLPDDFGARLQSALDGIKRGNFSREWEAERKAGYPVFDRLKDEALSHRINAVEDRLREIIRTDQAV